MKEPGEYSCMNVRRTAERASGGWLLCALTLMNLPAGIRSAKFYVLPTCDFVVLWQFPYHVPRSSLGLHVDGCVAETTRST